MPGKIRVTRNTIDWAMMMTGKTREEVEAALEQAKKEDVPCTMTISDTNQESETLSA
jgi:hypothetical protein